MRFITLFFVVILLMTFRFSNAQTDKVASVWYQEHLRVNFKTIPPDVETHNQPLGGSRSSTICDKDGNVLFYSNGISIWDRFDSLMDNGDVVNSTNGNYPINCVIVPHPADAQLYYVFIANDGDYSGINPKGLFYCAVDMSLNNWKGSVIERGISLIQSVAGLLTIVKDANEQSFWVISHGWNDNSFYSFRVSQTGIGSKVISTVGATYGLNAYQLKASPDGSKLAIAANGNAELYDFNAKTGVVSNFQSLGHIGATGAEFSLNSEFAYFATGEIDGSVVQFNVNAGTVDEIVASKLTVGKKLSTHLADLQLAYDGKIYASFGPGQAADSLPCVQFPNQPGASCSYTNAGLATVGGGIGNLPLSVQSFFRESPQMPTAEGCTDNPSSLRITSLGYADSIQWDFGDRTTLTYQGSSGKLVSHIYGQPGIYNVTAKKYIGNLSRNIQGSITIYEKPSVNLGADTVLCNGDVLILDAENGGNTYQWSTEDSTKTIEVKTTNTYTVTVDNGHCNNSDQIEVTFNTYPNASLGTDKVVCDGAKSVKLNVSDNAAYKIRWSTGDVVSETDVTESGQYKVQVSNGPCVSKDSIEVTFATVMPATFQDTTLVIPFDKELMLSEAGVNASKWTWDFGDGLQQVQSSPAVTHNYDRAGKYIGSVILSNDFGCNAKIPFEVEVPYHLLIPNVFTPNGDDKNETFDIQCNGDVSNFNLIVFDRWGQEVFESRSIENKWDAIDKCSGEYFYNVEIGSNRYNGWLQVIK